MKKLRRIIAWIKCTIDDPRIIGASNLSEIFTWIDAVYAVHDDMRSQTGGAMSMGHGILHCKSGKQRLNVKVLLKHNWLEQVIIYLIIYG